MQLGAKKPPKMSETRMHLPQPTITWAWNSSEMDLERTQWVWNSPNQSVMKRDRKVLRVCSKLWMTCKIQDLLMRMRRGACVQRSTTLKRTPQDTLYQLRVREVVTNLDKNFWEILKECAKISPFSSQKLVLLNRSDLERVMCQRANHRLHRSQQL